MDVMMIFSVLSQHLEEIIISILQNQCSCTVVVTYFYVPRFMIIIIMYRFEQVYCFTHVHSIKYDFCSCFDGIIHLFIAQQYVLFSCLSQNMTNNLSIFWIDLRKPHIYYINWMKTINILAYLNQALSSGQYLVLTAVLRYEHCCEGGV